MITVGLWVIRKSDYQKDLSTPICEVSQKTKNSDSQNRSFAVRTGLEPATPGVTGLYSNQLNYRTSQPFFELCKCLMLVLRIFSDSFLLLALNYPRINRII